MPNTRRPPSRQPAGRVSEIEAAKKKIVAQAEIAAPISPTSRKAIQKAIQPLKLGSAFTIGPVKPVGSRNLNMLVYGPYGHGKTTFAGSAEDVESMRDVLFVNSDSGTMSLTHRTTMDFINISNYDQLARIFEYLTLHCYYRDAIPMNKEKMLELEKDLKSSVVPLEDQLIEPKDLNRTWFEEQRLRLGKPLNEPMIFRTVILDSISELHKYLIYKYTGVDIGIHPLDEEIEKMESWQPAQELFRLLIRSFRDLPMNVIFVSAEEIAGRNDSDRKKGRRAGQRFPKLAGAVAGDVIGFIDIVGYLEREIEEGGTHRYLYLGAGYPDWVSKHRFENLPDLEFVENATLSTLIDLSRKDSEHGTSTTRTDSARSAITAPSSRRTSAVTANSSRRPVTTGGSRR